MHSIRCINECVQILQKIELGIENYLCVAKVEEHLNSSSKFNETFRTKHELNKNILQLLCTNHSFILKEEWRNIMEGVMESIIERRAKA